MLDSATFLGCPVSLDGLEDPLSDPSPSRAWNVKQSSGTGSDVSLVQLVWRCVIRTRIVILEALARQWLTYSK